MGSLTMNANTLFGMALGLGTGWKVVNREMDVEGNVGGHPKCTTSGHFKVHHFWT